MRASSDVLIPVETGYFSLHGLAKQLELLDQLSKQCHQEVRIRILATLYDIRTKLAREVLAELREQFGSLLVESTINFNTKLKEAASFGQPITEYDPASKGFKDFHRLARELMGPAPRLTLNLPRAVAAAETATEAPGVSIESEVARAQGTVEETLETMEEGIELSEPLAGIAGSEGGAPAPRRSQRVLTQQLQAQADSLARRAEEIKLAARRNMGIALATRTVTTVQKIEEFYGVRQVAEGLLFVAHFPNARSVAIAGEFNNWNPDRMSADREAEDTFRAMLALKPGRYRYRLVVDGQWQADPHNICAEPNPFGELDSIVEVV
jgi:hypothetical protein